MLGLGLGLNGQSSGRARPSLILNFAAGTGLDRITTARNTAATAIRNSDGAVLDFAPNEPRLVAGEGLDVWDATDEKLPNTTAAGTVAGTPGVTPSGGWGFSHPGLSRQIFDPVIVNGVNVFEAQVFAGTATGNVYLDAINNNSSTGVLAVPGEVWAGSFWFRAVSGIPAGPHTLRVFAMNVGNTQIATYDYVIPAGDVGTLKRHPVVTPALPANTTHVILRYVSPINNGTVLTGPYRFQFGLPSLRKGAFLQPPVKTSGSAALVPVDDVRILSPTQYTSLFRGSMVWEFYDPLGPIGQVRRGPLLLDGVNTRYIRLIVEADNRLKADYFNGTTGYQLSSTNPIASAGGVYRIAASWGDGQLRAAFSSNLGGSASAAIVPSPTEALTLQLGQNGPSGSTNGRWRRFEVYRENLPLSVLQAKAA